LQGEECSIAFDNEDLAEGIHSVRLKFLHDRVQQAAYG